MTTHVSPGVAGASTPSRSEAVEALYATGHWLYGLSRHSDAAAVFRVLARVAPNDERAWLALGYCHEALDQHLIALEMLGTGRVLAAPAPRCELARARILKSLGRGDEADAALDYAAEAAEAADDDEMLAAVRAERRA